MKASPVFFDAAGLLYVHAGVRESCPVRGTRTGGKMKSEEQ